MSTSANRTTSPLTAPRTETQQLQATFTGAGIGNPTLGATGAQWSPNESLNGEILSIVRVSTGVYTVNFRYGYPQLKKPPTPTFGPFVTAGLVGGCSAVDLTPTGRVATLNIFVGSTPTDLAAGDVVTLEWSVRNSNKNS